MASELRRVEREFVASLVAWMAMVAAAADLPIDDIETWRKLSDAQSSHYILNQPDLYWREAHILVIGYKP